MTTALIIIGIVAGTFMAFRFSNKIAVKRLNQENKEICDAHQQIEYPELEKNVQFRIMETGDYSPISNLIPGLKTKRTPHILLKHYIKISKNDFKEYLWNSNFLERHKIENAPPRLGCIFFCLSDSSTP